jgi:Mlc titration factor MtfA (ptsG expression regulator)
MNLQDLLYSRGSYQGRDRPPNAAFNAVLQEFSHRLDYISGLHTGGKISSLEAFEEIDDLWQHLESQRRALRIISSTYDD